MVSARASQLITCWSVSPRHTEHVFVWECCLSRASWSANSCLASRDTRLGLGGGRRLKWDQQKQRREEEKKNKKNTAKQGLHRNESFHLETWINGRLSTKTWGHTHTWSEMKWIFWAELHVMPEQDHHLFSTPSTTPHCAATAKTRLSSTLFCTGTAKGVKAWAATERWLVFICVKTLRQFCPMNFRKQKSAQLVAYESNLFPHLQFGNTM